MGFFQCCVASNFCLCATFILPVSRPSAHVPLQNCYDNYLPTTVPLVAVLVIVLLWNCVSLLEIGGIHHQTVIFV